MPVIWLIGIVITAMSLFMPSGTPKREDRALGTAIIGVSILIVSAILEYNT